MSLATCSKIELASHAFEWGMNFRIQDTEPKSRESIFLFQDKVYIELD
jgi:hypothetical protein